MSDGIEAASRTYKVCAAYLAKQFGVEPVNNNLPKNDFRTTVDRVKARAEASSWIVRTDALRRLNWEIQAKNKLSLALAQRNSQGQRLSEEQLAFKIELASTQRDLAETKEALEEAERDLELGKDRIEELEAEIFRLQSGNEPPTHPPPRGGFWRWLRKPASGDPLH